MADWWEKYKKDHNLGGNKKSSSERIGLKKEVRVTDENRQTAKSSTWWEDYKKTRGLNSKIASDRQRAERSQRFASANRQLDENRSRDAAEDEIRELFRNPFSSDAEWQAGVLQRNAERYKRDLPLYQQAMQNSSTWGEYFSAHRQAGESQSAVKHQFERYQQAAQKAEQDRDESNLVNRPALYASEHMTPEQISAELDRLRSGAATPTVTGKDRNDPAYAYMYPDAVLRKDPHGARFDERLVEDAGQDAIDAAYRPILTEQERAAVEQADRKIIEDKANRNYERVQILKAAQSMQTERTSRETGNQLMEEIATGGAAAKQVETGRAAFEAKQQQIASETSFEIGDDLDSNRGAYNKMQKERRERGYILGYDWDNVPEARKQAVYALYAQDPEKAMELAKYYIADARQAEDEERQAWYAQSGWTAALGLVSSAAAHLGAAVDPYGDVGQELTRYGDNALAGGSQWADAATGYQKIPEWVPIVGGKGAGDLYQIGGSVVQSAAVAAPAILAGRYDKAAAEVVGKLGLALMGSSAAASDYRESVAAGMDEDRAKLHALAAGVEEALFEEVSLDKIVSMDTSGGFKALIRNWLVQSGVEGSEELATDIANRVTDELISGAGQSKVERRTSELIANGMSATQAKQQAENEWLTDTLYDGFQGFLSGGMMVGGNYALQGVANLAGRAANTVETRKAQRQAGAAVSRSEGSVEALQAYAKDKGIEIKTVETAEQIAEESAEQGNQAAKQNSYSSRDYRSISDTTSKVTQSIRNDLRGKTVQEQQTVRDSLVEKYGEGIAPVVNNAISIETAARVRQEYGDVDSIQAARNKAVSEIKDESLRRAVSDGYDSAAYSLAASQGGEGGLNAMSRYIQQRRNTGSGSEMSMNATVTAQDGSTKAIAITGMSEDGKRVSLADGSEVAVKDLQADADTTSAIQQLADLDLGADATKVLQAYQQSGISGTEGYRWLMDYATAYNQGRTRQISLEQAAQRSSLDERTVMDAYTLGQQAANRETQAGLEKLKNLPKRKGASGRTANIDTTEIKGKTMSKSELEQFELANQYAQALGVDMTWFSSREKDGKFIDKNGAYENGKIYMDIHAGRNFTADLTSGILATMGHELTHFQQQYAPEEYQALKSFLFEQIVKSSPNGEARLERLIWLKQERSGYTLSRKAAEDEVVADACQKMLRDSKAVHDFASQQPEAANGVVRWLDKWFKRVRSIFGRGGNYSEEAKLMDSLEQDVKAAFGELWDKALKQAVQVHDEVGNIGASAVRGIEETGASEQMAEEAVVQNSDRLDDETLRFLDEQEHVTVYRAMQMIDGKLYPPMAAKVEGKLVDATELGEWYQAVERPDLIDPKTGKWKLDKANGKAIKAAYNPYFHTSATPLNDQFSSAYKRPNIVVVEGIIPKSELTSGYKAQYAKDPVGETKWHAGPVASKLKGAKSRRVFLSRWFQAQRVVSDAEVADVVAKTLEGENIAVPNNVVTPSLLEALKERGVAIDEDAIDRFESKHGMRQNSDRDTEYLELAKDPEKNAAKLQEMVDEAAKRTGFAIKAYHGTGSEFNSFDLQRSGSNSKELVGDSAEGMFFFSSIREAYPGSAQDYARIAGKKTGQEVIRDVYLKMENPLELDSKGWYATADYYDNNRDSIYDQYLSGDYDGIIIRDSSGGDDNTIYLLDDANRIKSAAPVTYDDQGNVIPLSERFNTENRDIRYSERDNAKPTSGAIENRVFGDRLLDAQDLIETVREVGGNVDSRGYITVYHRTTADKADQIRSSGKMVAKEDGLFFSVNPDGQDNQGYGDTVLAFRIPAEKLVLDDIFADDASVRLPLGSKRSMDVSKFLEVNSVEGAQFSERDNAKPRSAQAQRDAGYKLSESKFYSLYSAHKLNMIGKGNVQDQIASIMADGFKGDGGFGNNVMPTNISYDVDENGKRIPRGLSAQKYAPKKGEYILLVPKEGVEVKGGRYNFTERVKPGYKPAFDYEIVQADYDGQPYYEMYEKAYDKSQAEKADVTLDGAQFSERDYSTPSDEELLMNARVEDAANVEQGRELKDYQALGRRIATLEKQLAEAKRQTQLTNRALNTRGIGNVVKTVMKDYDITDARHNGTAKNATLALTDGYQKALDLLDKGASPAAVNDAVYNGAVKAAEIILEQGTYSQNLGGKWQTYSASRYLGENSQELIDSFVSEAYADFVSNRYREARPETAADRLVARTKKEAQERVDKYKGRSDALAEANRRLEEKTTQAETEAKEARKAAGELFLEIKDIRQELMDNKTMSEQERKAASKKLKSLNKSLEAKREEAASWQKRAKRNASLLKSALESKNRDISALNNRLSKEQAAALEKQKNLEAKLEKQIQRERDILTGKLRAPELVKLLKAEREKAEARVKKQKEQVFQNYKERKKATDLRGRIKNLSDEMKRRMTNPTDRAYVPASLYQSMTKLADVLDNVLSPNPGTKAEARYRAMMDAIRGMAREYEDVKNLDPVFASEYEQEISDAIGEIERILERKNASWIDNLTGDTQKGLAELNSDELQQLYDLMRQINYTITNATKVFGNSNYKSIFDAQRAVAEQQNSMKSLNAVSRLDRKKRLRLLNSLSVMRATEMMAGWDRSAALYQLMHGIEQGADDAWAWVMDYNKSMQDLKTGKNEKEYRQALTKQLDFGITDREGLKVTMTKMQALQILMTAEREEHNDKLLHLQAGGAVIRNATDLQNGKGAKARSQTISVTPELIQKISDSLTEWDRAYMKTVRDYFKREGKQTNEILYKLKHKVLKTEEFYVPYTVDRNYLEANLNEQQALNMWVKTPGSTNALKQKAKQPVIIDGMDTVMGQHVKEIGNYIGMAIPIRDFSKVYNGMIPTEGPNPLPVKETIERTFGKAGQHLLTQAVIDVQGGTARQNWESNISQFLNKLHGAFVKSALLINPSVTIKQAASYIAAESVISHLALERGNHPVWARTDESKSFMPGGLIAQLFARPEGKTAQRIYNEIDQYTSLHYQRRQGMSMAEIAEQANRTGPIKRRINAIGASMEQSKIGHAFRRTGENLNPITWIQRMDVATTAALWVACKEQAKLEKLTVGSEEFWKRTTELYERCIRETQPMYDGLHRTANQKQAGGLMQYLFPFRTVPIQNHGQLAASYEAYKAARESKNEAKIKEAGKFFRKTAWAQTESAFVFSAMTFLAAILKRKTKKYRDEEGELDAGSFTKGLLTDVGSTLISVLNPMYGSELFNFGSRAVDKFEGNSGYTYDAFSVGVVDMINDLASSGDRLLADTGKVIRGENVNAADFWNHAMNLLVKGGKLAGIPADTVKTYFDGTKGNIQDAIEGRIPALNDESWERDAATNARRYLKAYMDNDTKKASAVLAELRSTLSRSGKDEEKINEAIRKAVSAQAVEKVSDGTWTEEEAEAYLLSTGAYDDRENPQKDAWNAIRKGVAKSASADEEFNWKQYDELAEAVANGEDVTGLLTEYRNHGYSDDQINAAIKSGIQEAMTAGDLDEEEAADALIRYGVTYSKNGKDVVYDEQTAWKKVQEWADKAEHTDEEGELEDGYKYSAYTDLFDAVDANQNADGVIQTMVQNGGYDTDSLRGKIKEHLLERFIAGQITETALKNQLSRYCKITKTEDANEIVKNAKCKRDFGVYPDGLKEAFKDGDLSQNQAEKALQQYKGLSKADAQNRVQYWGYDGDLSENAWLKWNSELKGSGLSVENWEKVYKVKSSAKGTDANGDGRADSGTVKAEVVSYIDSMNIPKSQKKAIYLAFGWAASTMPNWR